MTTRTLSNEDKTFLMHTTLLEVSVKEGIDVDDLHVVHQKKNGVWFVARISTGRGVVRVFDSEF